MPRLWDRYRGEDEGETTHKAVGGQFVLSQNKAVGGSQFQRVCLYNGEERKWGGETISVGFKTNPCV